MLLLSGLSILFGGPKPGSVNTALPTPLVVIWAAVMAAGGALVVLAAVVPPLAALYFELVADPPLAVMCLVYAASVFMLAGWRAAIPVALVTGAAIAFAIRAVQVIRTLKAVHRELLREGNGP